LCGKCPLSRISHGIKPDARRLIYPTIAIRIDNISAFVIDSHFKKYYTHHIEVTPICDYFTKYPVMLIKHTRIYLRVLFIFPQKRRLIQWILD